MIDDRRMGATSISRRKPNSRSHTTDTPENTAVNITDVASTPGNRNVRKSTSSWPTETTRDRPVPSTNSQSRGCTRPAASRRRSFTQRRSSRWQTMRAARRSAASPEGGRRMASTGRATAHRRPRNIAAMSEPGVLSASRMVRPV